MLSCPILLICSVCRMLESVENNWNLFHCDLRKVFDFFFLNNLVQILESHYTELWRNVCMYIY